MRRIPNLGGAFLALVHLWIVYVTADFYLSGGLDIYPSEA
jgi:hypothetical protein